MRSIRTYIAVLLAIAALMLSSMPKACSQTTPTEGLSVRVEPRLTTVNGVIRIYVLKLPPGYNAVVARLEGPVTTGYVTLTPGSVAAIDLHLYDLKPGLYRVSVYDAPGGRLLASIPVLIVKPIVTLMPPKPTIGEPFTITVAIQPSGYDYRITVHIDGKMYTVKPGERLTITLRDRALYTLCLDVTAEVHGETYSAVNVTCMRIRLNMPPSIDYDVRVENNYLVLVSNAMDSDGTIVAVNYTCIIGNETYSGFISPGLSRTILTTLDALKALYQRGARTLKCIVEAVDDAGAITVKEKTFNITMLLGATKSQGKRKTPSQVTRRPGGATTSPVAQATEAATSRAPPPLLPLPLLIVAGVGGAAAATAFVMLRRRKRPTTAKTVEIREATMEGGVDLTSVIVRLDSIERKVDELYARVGELQGEVDELRRRVRRLERSENRQGR